jgi:hypothetical protein
MFTTLVALRACVWLFDRSIRPDLSRAAARMPGLAPYLSIVAPA